MITPLVTVIIPTINEAATLGVAIQSIVDQTYKNLEIIVIDDFSTDNTEEIVRKFEQLDNRVKYVKCPIDDPKRLDIRGTNVSVGYIARNFAMDMSKGEWITFQDADDASLLNRIEVQLSLAQKYNATCITTYSKPFSLERLNKRLDIESVFKNEKDLIIFPKEICDYARKTKGILMSDWFPHNIVPFVFKKRIPTRKLFIASIEAYPGHDGAPFFRRETIAKAKFRNRDQRVWPAVSGRGVGRDHLLQIAETYKNSYSFKLPLYLWRPGWDYEEFKTWDKYLIN